MGPSCSSYPEGAPPILPIRRELKGEDIFSEREKSMGRKLWNIPFSLYHSSHQKSSSGVCIWKQTIRERNRKCGNETVRYFIVKVWMLSRHSPLLKKMANPRYRAGRNFTTGKQSLPAQTKCASKHQMLETNKGGLWPSCPAFGHPRNIWMASGKNRSKMQKS